MLKISKEEDEIIRGIFKKLSSEDIDIIIALILQVKNKNGIYHDIKRFGADRSSSSFFIANLTGFPKKESGLLSMELWCLTRPDIDRDRQDKIGIKYGIWVYEDYLCKHPSHAELNKKKFLLKKGVKIGFFKRINTGQLVGCRCMYTSVMPW